MHCYFHLSNGLETIIDQEGIEVENFEEAHEQAREAVAEVLRDDEGASKDWQGWHIQVTDVTGTLLCKIDLIL